MRLTRPLAEPLVVRQVFKTWSIGIPDSFTTAFVIDGSSAYWHAYDECRSVSLTSLLVTDRDRPVPARALTRQLPPLDGTPVDALPPALDGRAVFADAVPPARASRILSGMLVGAGRLLIVTITSDDLEWTRQVWLSIRHHPVRPARRR